MKHWYLAPFFALSTILATSTGTSAQETIDVAKITCEQFLTGRVEDSRSVTMWLSGYYHGIHNMTLLDVSALQQNSQAVMEYCITHPTVILMDAVTLILDKQK